VKSSQKRLYRRERNFANVFVDDQRSTSGQAWLFGALQTFARARAAALAGFSRAMCRLHRNPRPVASPIFVALGDETDMEENRYKYHA
jgi:hypothetical protein